MKIRFCLAACVNRLQRKSAFDLRTVRRASHVYSITSALVLMYTISVSAQQTTGAIAGTVKDGTGALVTAANVTATNLDTSFARSTKTDGEGNYYLQHLPVGAYRLEVEGSGFKKFVQSNIVLTVDQTQALNVTLEVGAANQTVEITTAPSLMNTDTAGLGRLVSPEEITNLPLVNRNAYAELSLTVGVQANSTSSASNPNGTPNFVVGAPGVQVQVNGSIDEGSPMVSYYLDGGQNMSGIRNYGNAVPNPDALQEFRVETANFAAEYGKMSGAIVTVVTKSGTNQFHGSLFEYNRNTDLNAVPWGSATNNPYHRNQFGGTVGGPILRDKAFFFFSYGGLRQSVGAQYTGGLLPTAAERAGNFIGTGITPINPATGLPYPNNQVPVDPVVTSMLADIPLPNLAGTTNGYTSFTAFPTNQTEYLGKYDQSIGSNDHLAVSYFTLNSVQDASGGGNFFWTTTQSFSRQQNVNISDVHTFTGTTANEVWLTYIRVAGGRVNLPATPITAFGSNFTTQGPATLPNISVSGYFTVGGGLAGPVSNTDYYSLRDIVSFTKGRHTLEIGGELSLEKNMFAANLANFGVFSFTGKAPLGTTGNALSDFIAGNVASMEQDTPYHGLLNSWNGSIFVQDNFRVKPGLVLNMGLRYDIPEPPVESQNLTATFVPGVQSTVSHTAPLGLLFPGDTGVARGIISTPGNHISPRLGIVWDPFGNGRTAITAAGGLFWGSVSGNEWNQPANAQPFAIRQTFANITSLENIYGNAVSFPNGNPFPYIYSASNPRFLPAASPETIDKGFRYPLTYQLNSAIQRQLPGNLSLTAAYVGALTHHVPFENDENYAQWAPGASTSQTSLNARRPYDPGVLGTVSALVTSPNTAFHSLQISVRKPLSHNFSLGGYYMFSKTTITITGAGAVGTASGAQDFNNLWEEKGLANTDRAQMASMSGIWNLDYYTGGNLLIRVLANGWTISPVVSLNSGAPFTVTTGTDNNADSYNSDRPNYVPGVSPYLSPHRSRVTAAGAWFNKAAFTPNGPGLPGGIGPGGSDGNVSTNTLRAPGYRDIDLALRRTITFEHGIKFQISCEATNAFNMVSLSAPNTTLSSPNVGKVTSAYTPRLIQLGARLTF
jgi:Carboxypeptidase regulatory-like domain